MKRAFFTVVLLAAFLILGCRKKEGFPVPTAPEKNAGVPAESLATAPVNYLAASAKAEQSMQKNIDTAAINNAIQLFGAQEGSFPKDLNELVTKKYLGKLPVPPLGTKLQYDAKEGKVSVVKE